MRLVLYDRTCTLRSQSGGRLTPVWAAGGALYRALGRVDRVCGVASWREAIAVASAVDQPIRELQYWGHGKWGCVLIGERDALVGERFAELAPLRANLAPDAVVWFRTCETFGARAGHDFAARLADYLGARVAGHTFVIGYHQSGLHTLAPGMSPSWSASEGIAAGDPLRPERAEWSRRRAPHTVTCLTGAIPTGW